MDEEDILDALERKFRQDKQKARAERNMMFWDSRTPESRFEGQRVADPHYTLEIARPRRGRY